MDTHRRIVSIPLICVLLLVFPFETGATQLPILENRGYSPEAIDITQLIPDPNLESEPDAFVNGTSGEFSYAYIDGNMQITWNHIDGTSVDLHDFVYFTQSIDWPYEEFPKKAYLYLNHSVTLTGGFMNTSGLNMFKLYVWLIDSSGDWTEIYDSNPPYNSDFHDQRVILNYVDLLNGIHGMIEDEFGVQEDPEDILTIGIGLAPTDFFQSSLDTGTVSVSISSVSLHTVWEAEPDPVTHLTPLFNQTFNTNIDNLRPGLVDPVWEIEDGVWDFMRQITKDPDGNIYLTGECSTTYDVRQVAGYFETHQFLIKYSPTLNRQWIVRNDNQTRGRVIAYHDGHIYTTGYFYRDAPEYYNLMLTKWSTSGQKIWEKEWGGIHDQVGVGIAVHDDGSIYVLVSDFNIRSEPAYSQNASLIKFDSSGNVVNITQPLVGTTLDVPLNLWISENRIIYHLGGLVACLDLEGDWIWGDHAEAVTCDENGTVYSALRDYESLRITKYDLEGNQTWSSLYQLEYPNGWFERFAPCDLSLTPTDELTILVQCDYYDDSYYLLKYSLDGDHLQTWSIGDFTWPYPYMGKPLMEVTSTGLAYFCYHPMGRGPWTQAFVIGDYTLPPRIPENSPIILVGGGIATATLLGVYAYKRKRG
jgi:hypothetical protein